MESSKMMGKVPGGADGAGHAKRREAHDRRLMFLQCQVVWHGWRWDLWWGMSGDENI